MAKPSPSYSGQKELVALGDAIRGLRLKAGLSQEAFADEAGIDRSYLGGIERGEHNVAIMNLIKITDILKITLSDLFRTAKL
jgi:transcriptional regulator with XRE-family HTH domain